MTKPPDGLTPHDGLTHDQRRARRPNVEKKFYRSSNKMIAGIAGGVAEYIEANPRNVRIVFVLTLILTSGFFVIPYLVLWWLLPVENKSLL
jgi:phage shock protein PspC (stress-responsive transcriptional regulator)